MGWQVVARAIICGHTIRNDLVVGLMALAAPVARLLVAIEFDRLGYGEVPVNLTTRRRRTQQGVSASERVRKTHPESGFAHVVAAQHELESLVGALFQARKHLRPRFG